MNFDFVKDFCSVPEWFLKLRAEIEVALVEARRKGYEKGFEDGQGLSEEAARVVSSAMKLSERIDPFNKIQMEEILFRISQLQNACKAFQDKKEEI